MKVRPGTRAECREFYNGIVPPGISRIWVAEKDGEIMGVGGYRANVTGYLAFTDNKPEMTKIDRVRSAVEFMKILTKLRGDVYATTVEFGPKVVEHYGFEKVSDDVWRLRNV